MKQRHLWGRAMIAGIAGLGAANAGPVEYARDASRVVVTMREVIGEIAEPDRGPSLTVYGDGRAVAHYPAYMTRPGDHSIRLSAAELDALVGSLARGGVLDFDAALAAEGKRRADTARRAAHEVITVSSDAVLTIFEVHTTAGLRRAAWNGLADDARRYPGVSSLQNLAAARQDLLAVMDRARGGGNP